MLKTGYKGLERFLSPIRKNPLIDSPVKKPKGAVFGPPKIDYSSYSAIKSSVPGRLRSQISTSQDLLSSLQNPSQVSNLSPVNLLKSHSIINDHYNKLTYNILQSFYPKYCNNHSEQLLEASKVKGRQLMGKCPICHSQKSLAKDTPLQNLHLPLSFFSFILHEIITSYPNVVTAKAIQRKLNLKSYTSAWLLKKRCQVFMSQLNESFLRQTKEALELEAKQNHYSKMPFRGEVGVSIKDRVVTNIDTCALFSVSVRANKFRSRYRHGGITSSIYRSIKSGSDQVGTLASNITIKGSLSFYESHPLTTTYYALSHLSKVINTYSVLMADEAYSSLFGKYRNVRLINHSLKAKRKIHSFSKERWSKEGVNTNSVEGSNGVLKSAMRQYRWFNCKYSQLYLNEFAVAKNIKFFNVEKKIIFGENQLDDFCGNRIGEIEHNNYRNLLESFKYVSLNVDERKIFESSNLKNSLTLEELEKLPSVLQSAIRLNDFSVNHLRGDRLRRERKYRFIYRKIFNYLNKNQWTDLDKVTLGLGLTKSECMLIIKKMTLANLLETVVYTFQNRDKVRIKLRYETFYQILITSGKAELEETHKRFKNKAKFKRKKSNYTGFKNGSKYD